MTSAEGDPAGARSRWPRTLGTLVGLALLLGAIFFVLQQREQLTTALEAIRAPSPLLIILILGSVAVNLILSSLVFSLLIARYGRVGVFEMQALICSTALLNYLPLRPGLLGRVAYHRAVNNIALLDSARVLVQGALLTLVAASMLVGIALLSHSLHLQLELLLLVPATIAGILVLIPNAGTRLWAVAGLIRYTEVLLWAVRYQAAFALIGSPIDAPAAIGLAAVSILATMIPLLNNGLGVREWLIGLLAPVIAGYRLELGVVADLVNRAGELLIVVAMGSAGLLWIGRKRSARDSAAE